jgi:hypothetical protein
MAIEEADLPDREVWSGVARTWYNKAADKSPNVGRIQHHLAVLARPNIVQQLFYSSKALVSTIPFQNTQESVMLLFNLFLEESEIANQRYPLVELSVVKANGVLFTRGPISEYTSLVGQLRSIWIITLVVRWRSSESRVQRLRLACVLRPLILVMQRLFHFKLSVIGTTRGKHTLKLIRVR